MVTGNMCVIILGKLILKMGESKTKTDPQILFKMHDPNKMHCQGRLDGILFSPARHTHPCPCCPSTLSRLIFFRSIFHLSIWMTNFPYHAGVPVCLSHFTQAFVNPWIALNIVNLKCFPRKWKENPQTQGTERIQETGRHQDN